MASPVSQKRCLVARTALQGSFKEEKLRIKYLKPLGEGGKWSLEPSIGKEACPYEELPWFLRLTNGWRREGEYISVEMFLMKMIVLVYKT